VEVIEPKEEGEKKKYVVQFDNSRETLTADDLDLEPNRLFDTVEATTDGTTMYMTYGLKWKTTWEENVDMLRDSNGDMKKVREKRVKVPFHDHDVECVLKGKIKGNKWKVKTKKGNKVISVESNEIKFRKDIPKWQRVYPRYLVTYEWGPSENVSSRRLLSQQTLESPSQRVIRRLLAGENRL